jgi:hypothetical protein
LESRQEKAKALGKVQARKDLRIPPCLPAAFSGEDYFSGTHKRA